MKIGLGLLLVITFVIIPIISYVISYLWIFLNIRKAKREDFYYYGSLGDPETRIFKTIILGSIIWCVLSCVAVVWLGG